MRSSTTSTRKTSTVTHSYSPSVPLSVYRELATDLQAVEAMLDSLDAQNQQLARQNQQLRKEIEKAVQAALHLKQVAESAGVGCAHVRPPVDSRPGTARQRSRPPSPTRKGTAVAEKVFIEQEQGRYRRRVPTETTGQISGWWLAIAILLIVVTAFSAGYLLVRPLLQNR